MNRAGLTHAAPPVAVGPAPQLNFPSFAPLAVPRWYSSPGRFRLKILLTGDIHIGRRSSRLPTHLDQRTHSCAAAWGRVVDLALTEKVDLVAVSGDLVDKANRYLEAIGPLERGLRKLASAEIMVVVVAGNHDFDVLPALVESVGAESFRLLGHRGRWERLIVERGGDRLYLDGWSFPQAHWHESPLATYAPEIDRTPVFTLLHADLEQPGSSYAPISLSELRRHPEVYFLLGHVHEPRAAEEPGGARFIYPGSPQAMDPGESGEHGVWLLEVENGEAVSRQVPLSTIDYEAVDVAVDGIERPEEADGRVFTTLRDRLTSVSERSSCLELVRFRVRVTGATGVRRAVEDRLKELAGEFELSVGTATGTIESLSFAMSPVHDLGALASGAGAPAVLANLLRRTELDPALRQELLSTVSEIQGSRSFLEVSGGPGDLAALEQIAFAELDQAAAVLLDELLLQKATTP
jgi:exonuclease SbcD